MSSAEADDLTKKTKDLKLKDDTFINILLLGETGVGKSTFINSIANYLTHNDIKKAKKEDLIKLIPSKCTVQDKHGECHVIHVGSENDQNECLDTGMSATQDVQSYVFPIWNGKKKVRLIDTPGIGDVRGIDQDNINCESILNYIGQLHELHAICYLFKPLNPRITAYFDYCMTQILSRLDKSASRNIIFIFTNTRGTDYGPGDTFPSLQKVIKDIKSRPPYVDIPLNKNVFCFDNEAFRYLAAVKEGIEFDSAIKQRNYESWKRSVEQCNRLIKYIVGDSNNPPLKPHHIKSTSAINEARRFITQLSQPLAEIAQLINDNLFVLQRHKEDLNLNSESLDELKKKLYMPVIDLEVIKLTQPVTVCASKKCADIYKVEGINKWHYKQRCHDPCYLTNVPKEVIGSPELINCAAINSSTRACHKCQCDFSAHMHVYYFTKTVDGKKVDSNIKLNIDSKEKLMQKARKLIDDISIRKDELEKEHSIIVKASAKFAHFLQNNAITPFNDSYKEYLKYLIIREQSLGVQSKMSVIHHLQNLLKEYEAAKQSFDEALSLQKRIGETDVLITPQKIQDTIQELYKLKHNGKKIKELYECQKKSRSKEHKYTEYIHEVIAELEEDRSKAEKKDKNKNTKKSAGPQKKQTTTDGNQRNDNQQRGRDKSQTRHRVRNPSPPPPYQDLHPPRPYNRQVPHQQQYQDPSRPYYPPHNYHGPQYPPQGPSWSDYSHPGNPSSPQPSYGPHQNYRGPPGPEYRQYNSYNPGRDERDHPARARDGNETDSYEFKILVNKPQRGQEGPPGHVPPPHLPPHPPQRFYPPAAPHPYYHDNPQQFSGPYDYYNQNTNMPRQRSGYQPNQNRPDEQRNRTNYRGQVANSRGQGGNYRGQGANYRGQGGFRGGRGAKTPNQKFKTNIRKKKSPDTESDSDSSSD